MGNAFLRAAENPFAIERVSCLPFDFLDCSLESIDDAVEHMRRLKFRAGIVGRHGTGKTTLLKCLHRSCKTRGIKSQLFLIPRDRSQQSESMSKMLAVGRQQTVLFVDGIERLSLARRWRFYRQSTVASGLVITAHRHCFLPTLVHTSTSFELLVRLMTRLDQTDPRALAAAKVSLKKHQGNVRSALRELYDLSFDDILENQRAE